MERRRPSHTPSKNLSEKELQYLYDLLGNDCVTLATAVTQILYGYENVWKKQACGVLCYVKDYQRRIYCFRLYNLRSKESIYEEITPVSLFLEKVLDLFYTFDGSKCKVGINFIDQIEAETFCQHFHRKQADRRKKWEIEQSKTNTVSTMMNEIKTPIPPSTANKQNNSKKSKNLKKKKHDQLVISKPIIQSFQHVMHVAQNNSFLTDATKKQLFDEVLDSMHISPEEKSYIRKTISSANDGLEKLFTKSIRDPNTQEKQMLNSPLVPPRTLATREHTPHQDISPPSISFNPPQLQNTIHTSNDSQSSKAPIAPPRPPCLASNNTPHSNKSKPAPPPPIPTNSHNSSVPAPPPPPPLPANLFNPNSIPPVTLNGSSASSSNTNQNSLLNEICSFNKEQFKSATQRPTPPIKSPENNEKLNVHHTLEENIRFMLDKRRQDIMGRDNDDENDESDSNDDEWNQ